MKAFNVLLEGDWRRPDGGEEYTAIIVQVVAASPINASRDAQRLATTVGLTVGIVGADGNGALTRIDDHRLLVAPRYKRAWEVGMRLQTNSGKEVSP